jgi:hypothetical protein
MGVLGPMMERFAPNHGLELEEKKENKTTPGLPQSDPSSE